MAKTEEMSNAFKERKALYIHERRGFVAERDHTSVVDERRLKKWLGPPFSDPEILKKRLEADKLDLGALKSLFAIGLDTPREQQNQCDMLKAPVGESLPKISFDIDAHLQNTTEPNLQLLRIFRPLLIHGVYRLETLLLNHIDEKDKEKIVGMWFPRLASRLLSICTRTLVLEMNVCKLRDELSGESSSERFDDFILRMSTDTAREALFIEYPVLLRSIGQVIDQWVSTGQSLFERLQRDWSQICLTFFSGTEPGEIVNITSGLGDVHQGGQSVISLTFSRGESVVYKPRSLAVEQAFQSLLIWINGKATLPEFKVVKVLDRKEYGWMEFIPFKPCTSEAQVQNYFQRQGIYLAFLHVMGATDIHCENMIAHGPYPIIVDLETLFHSQLEGGSDASSDEDFLKDSVHRVGLLPFCLETPQGKPRFGYGGLDNIKDHRRKVYVKGWLNAGTDEMALGRLEVSAKEALNAPELFGKAVSPSPYLDQIEEGFQDAYQFILNHRDDFSLSDSPFEPFRAVKTRAVLRGTVFYSQLLDNSWHPDFLRDGLDRDRFLDNLWVSGKDPYLCRLIQHEKKSLLQGDIPIFSGCPDKQHLIASDGTLIENILQESPFDRFHQVLAKLDRKDMLFQRWVLRNSVTLFSYKAKVDPSPLDLSTARQAEPSELLASAVHIGDRLCQLALDTDDQVHWLHFSNAYEGEWRYTRVGNDFYNGKAGIALFLGYLYKITGKDQFGALAKKCAASFDLERPISNVSPGLSGLAGRMYSATHLGHLLKDPGLIRQAEGAALTLDVDQLENAESDVISGCASLILAILGLYHLTQKTELIEVATKVGDCLLGKAVPMEKGFGWRSCDQPRCLTGYSHGTAGIAHAFAALYGHGRLQRFKDAAFSAIAYENAMFDKEEGNWFDLRTSATQEEGTKKFMAAWCHGAPGIGLSRLGMRIHCKESQLTRDLHRAVEHTIQNGFGNNHSLCHGDLGNLELLLSVAVAENDRELKEKVYRIASVILEDKDTHGWRYANHLGIPSPGFMLGLSGMGYQLLRLAQPELVPSALILEPPRL